MTVNTLKDKKTALQATLGLTWKWFQVVLAGVAIAVSAILWLLQNNPDLVRVLLFVFVTGYWWYPPAGQDVTKWFGTNIGLATLMAILTGISTYAVQSTRNKLEAEKEQLRKEVYQGLKKVQAQESQLQAAFEIQANLLPKMIPQIGGVQISCACSRPRW